MTGYVETRCEGNTAGNTKQLTGNPTEQDRRQIQERLRTTQESELEDEATTRTWIQALRPNIY